VQPCTNSEQESHLELNLKGKTALVTGASKGIGRAVAEGFAQEGCRIHMVARSQEPLQDAVDAISAQFGVETIAHVGDLSDTAFVSELPSRTGDVDILVNNAGAIPRGSLIDVDDRRWRDGWELKVFGYIAICRIYYPRMSARQTGVILNIIGVSGERADANYIATATANSGLMMFSESLGGESVRHGVRVVGVNPGVVATDRFMTNVRQRAVKMFGDESRWTDILKDLPIGRLAKPQEIADTVVFLASERASYISGVTVTVDGGLRSRPPTGI
jgi:NAD(P)-dependent dehydrogenase (short-subunit alcohol dehydrogenase family)